MTTPFINAFVALLFSCCLLSTVFLISYKNQNGQLRYTERVLKHKSDSLIKVIKSQEEEIDILQDQIQEREIEITYWGMKYDSCSNKY
jgi:vacuolar-type H+-ATPase subunit D/Vma8